MSTGVIKKITPSLKQQECIDALNGPVMVLAGPGTGKTFTVIQRLKSMLSKGIKPESILCLTFSETAAAEMKTRLVQEVGSVASALKIGTYHAFCHEIISQYPMQFEFFSDIDVVDDISRYRIVREIFEEIQPEALRTSKGEFYYYIKPVISAIDEIKNTRTTKEKYFEIIDSGNDWGLKLKDLLDEKYEKEQKTNPKIKGLLGKIDKQQDKIAKAKEIWEVFETYQERLKTSNYIDFNDMINYVLDEFEKDEEFLEKVSFEYKYFLVDEYQDTNFSQNQLVFKLAQGSNVDNVFVVGDDDQIIYGFQGAQSDNLEKFLRHYPATKVICLDENRRSTQNILDFSYGIISQDEGRLENQEEFSQFEISKKLTAKNEKINTQNKPIELLGFVDDIQEQNFLINKIEELASENEQNLSDIAVLVNKNAQAQEIAERLKARNIPFQLKSKNSIFGISASILVIFYLKALVNPVLFADKLFGLLLSEPFSINPYDYSFLLEKSRINHKDFIFNIRENLDNNWVEKELIENFLSTYDELKAETFQHSLKNFILEVVNQTGILEFYTQSKVNRNENISAINRLIKEAQNFSRVSKSATLNDFINHLDVAYKEDLEIKIDGDDEVKNAVQLMTLHGSKGREFAYVFMPNLIAKNWEKKRTPNSLAVPVDKNDFDEMSEHLRLLFVGITRAKHSLYITYSNAIEGKPQELSKYLGSISFDNKLVEFNNIKDDQYDPVAELAVNLRVLKYDYKFQLSSDLNSALKNIVLSPSSLNAYIACPRAFLYSNVYKIPARDQDMKNLNYGTAVHFALEKAVRIALEKGVYPSLGEFKELFVDRFNSMPLHNKFDRENMLVRGDEKLSAYYPHFANVATERLYATEFSLGKVLVDGIFITGKIDKIEKNQDGTYCLYDYKTGKSVGTGKKINEVSHEKYLNQIRFYKLAFETLNKDAKVSQVGLIYVEDFEKNYMPELCEQDNEFIKEKILETYRKINALEFEPVCSKQASDSCKFCNYKMLCKLNVI